MSTLKRLQSGLYNIAEIASQLYPDLKRTVATAKLTSKIKELPGRKLSDAELKKIETILK